MDLLKRLAPWEAVKAGNSEAVEAARELIRKQWKVLLYGPRSASGRVSGATR